MRTHKEFSRSAIHFIEKMNEILRQPHACVENTGLGHCTAIAQKAFLCLRIFEFSPGNRADYLMQKQCRVRRTFHSLMAPLNATRLFILYFN